MKIFVPGRICLLGEHSDWAGGYRRTNAAVEKGSADSDRAQGTLSLRTGPFHLILISDRPKRGSRRIRLDKNADHLHFLGSPGIRPSYFLRPVLVGSRRGHPGPRIVRATMP